MFAFIKRMFFAELTILLTWSGANSLCCVSMTIKECRVRPEIINVNSDEPVFYPFSIKISKSSGSCNDLKNPYAKMCVPDIANNLNVKVFYLMPITNKTRHIKWHETCKCKCKCL